MLRFAAVALFLLLAAATVRVWQNRFVADDRVAQVDLADFSAAFATARGVNWSSETQQLELTRLPGAPPIVIKHAFPGIATAKAIHFSLYFSSNQLTSGPNPWDDGRCFLEWRDPKTHERLDISAIGSIRGTHRSEVEVVLRAPSEGAIPILLLEHLGTSGTLTIETLVATSVHQSRSWAIFRVVLPFAWVAWAWFSLVVWSRHHRPIRHFISALVFVAMGLAFVLPGPWKALRPVGLPFELNLSPAALKKPSTVQSSPNVLAPRAVVPRIERAAPPRLKPVGELPVQGGMVLKIKKALPLLRPLLHVLLLFGPALAFAFFSGRRAAIVYGGLLSVLIEAAQTSMGYGFDAWDVLDLACDSAGIALALLLHHRLQSWPLHPLRQQEPRASLTRPQ